MICRLSYGGQALQIHRKHVAQGLAPCIFHTCPSAFQVTSFVGGAEYLCLFLCPYVFVSFCRDKCIFSLTSIAWWQMFSCNKFCSFWTWMPGKNMSSTAGDISVSIRIDMCGVTSLQTNPNPATFVHKVLEKIHFLMSDLWKSSIKPAKKKNVPTLWIHMKNHPALNNHGTFFPGFWCTCSN